jgi:acyl dehydratase
MIERQRMDPVGEKPIALYLEDLHVGQRFTSDSYHMDENRIKALAAEFDPQPFHLDEAVAKTSVFNGLSASGWHTAAVAMRLLVTGGLPLGNGIIGLGGELAWPRPTRPGDTLRWKARFRKYCRRVRNRTRVSSSYEAVH